MFAKAQAVREAGGFKLSRDALISQLHSKTPLGTDALVTGQAIALAVGNHLRTDRNPDLKSAATNLALLKRLQLKLPADLAAKLAPKINSLEAAINRTTAAVQSININVATGFHTTGPFSHGTPLPTRSIARPRVISGDSPGQGHAAGFLGLTTGASDLGVAGEAGREAIAILKHPKALKAASKANVAHVFVTNWPKAVDQTSQSSDTTAAATSTIAKETVKAATQKQMVAALKAIKERAIAAGHLHPTKAQEKATYEHDVKRGITLDRILTAKWPVIHTTVSTRDSINGQNVKGRYGKTSTQVGAQ